MLLFAVAALAADLAVYRGAVRLVQERYLWPERIVGVEMFRAAGDRLEQELEWLQTSESGDVVKLRAGRWSTSVRYTGDLAADLAHLEDAVRSAEFPVPDDVDLRAEILRGAVSTLDRHTVVLSGNSLERFDERLSGTLTGIGVTLRSVEGHLTVIEVFAGGPAAVGGVRADDRVVRIDGTSTVGMTPADATERIRGRTGTPVHLTIQRGTDHVEVDLERREITIPNVTHAVGPRGVGVVKIEHFSEQTTANLEGALAALRSAQALHAGLVIDLRGNTGGSLIQSAKTADMFVDAGRLVMTAGRGGDKVPGLVRNIDARPEALAYDGPLVVLIDHETASGAEIVAGALLHLDRALLVGETSFGKGTVQTLYPLAEGLKLKLTVAEYVLDDEARVAGVGLVPDLAMYPVGLSDAGIWYADEQRVRSRLAAHTPLLHWADATGIDGATHRDDPLEVAAALLTSGVVPARDSLVGAYAALLPAISAQTTGRLVDVLHGEGLDWTPATSPPGDIAVDAHLVARTTPRAGETTELAVQVTNRGAALARAALRLRSANPAWDDRLLPIGALAAGARAEGRVRIPIDAEAPGRVDRVVGVLECDGCEPLVLVDTTLEVEGAEPPRVAVDARLDGDAVLVEFRNHSAGALSGVRAKLAFPGVDGIELLDPPAELAAVAAGGTHSFRLPLRLDGRFAESTLPLELELRADGHGVLARWSLPVPRDGKPVHRDPPDLVVRAPRSRQPAGTTTLSIRAADGDGLDHLLVFGGTERVDRQRWEAQVRWDDEKLYWSARAGKRASQTLEVPVARGTNRFTVIAEGADGLRTARTVYVYGEGEAPVDDGVAFVPSE